MMVMKTTLFNKLMPLSAVALAVTPLEAETSQEMFEQLVQPVQTINASVEARAAAMPALELLPQKTDGVIVAPKLGEHLFAKLAAGCSRASQELTLLSSIDCLVLSAAEGSATTLKTLLALTVNAQLVEFLNETKNTWQMCAKKAYAHAIASSFEAEEAKQTAQLKQNVENMHVAPIYLAATAKPGKETDFDQLHELLLGVLMNSAGRNGVESVEQQGFAGVKVPYKNMAANNLDYGLRKELSELVKDKYLYILIKKQEKSMIALICSDPADIALPSNPADSLLQSSALSAADAHLNNDELRGAVWVSPSVLEAYKAMSMYASVDVMLSTVVDAFEKIAAEDAPNAAAFREAAQGVEHLNSMLLPKLGAVKAPATLTIWQSKDEVRMQCTYDAMGIHYEEGALHAVSLAEAPDTILYGECTAINFPNMPRFEGAVSASLAVSKGFALSAEEVMQDQISPCLLIAENFQQELLALGEALQTVGSGLTAPCALVVSKSAGNASGPLPVSVAFNAGVKNRAALGEGWKKLLGVAQQAASKMGFTGDIASMLPVMARSMAQGTVSYMCFIPGLVLGEPQLTVSDKSFVVGNSSQLSDKLVSLAEGTGKPFRGVAFHLNLPALMEQIRNCSSSPTSIFVNGVQSVSVTQTDNDGVMCDQWRIILEPKSSSAAE